MINISSFNFYVEKDDFADLEFITTPNEITIKNKHFCCPQFLFKKDDENDFVLTTNCKDRYVLDYDGRERIRLRHSEWEVKGKRVKTLDMDENIFDFPYQVINNYKEIKITRDGKLTVTPQDFSKLHSVPIEDSKELILEWKEKYSDLVADYCRQNKFIPTLTGGCDTRILTYFWRKHNLKQYRLRAIKQDGKENVEKGKKEIEISKEVLNKMGLNLERIEEAPAGITTINGAYTEQTQHIHLVNDKNFVKNVINKCNWEWAQIQPFLDDNYLMIKQAKKLELRCLFLLLFCPDLLDIRMISTAGEPIYTFDEKFKNVADKCKIIIERWGLKNGF